VFDSYGKKQHCFSPFQFRLVRLSFIKTTSLYMYHIKILIFKRIFSLHIILFLITIPLFINAIYIEWTENLPCRCKFQWNKSALLFKRTSKILVTWLCESTRLFPVNFLRNETFSGTLLRTLAIESLFLLMIL
jgi:hypothetical protein